MPDRHPPKYPRILVGIDLGLTCTGVAFSTTDWLNPKIIQTWPGISQIKNKVPTAVQYRAGNRDFKAWGFECPPPWQVQNQMGVKDLFKLFLDENCLKQTFESNQDFAVGTYQDVRNWYTDFLNAIYKYISAFIKENLELPDWKLHTVDFLFSYPTTWGEEVVAEFRKVVEAAGFGSGGKYHNVEVKLTEAEAAAIYTADSIRQEFPNTAISDTMSSSSQTCDDLRLQVGNVILVCDSGGGTTDVAVVEVRSLKDVNVDDKDGGMGRLAEFTPLGEPNGLPIGSVQIDEDFRCVLRRRLSSIPNVRIPDEVVDEVVRADFQSHKLNLGGSLELPICHFPIKGLGDSFTLEEARIEDGAVMFTRQSIQELFDDKISGICRLIKEQTDRLFEQHEGKEITHLMLSGGLCSSKYVQTQLKERHDGQMKILIAKDPQLAVCKGLVIDSLHRLKYNNYILPDRFINHSYGIVSNEIYNNRKHHRQRKHREKDLISGEELVRQIHWLIIRAKPISKAKPITHKFYRHVDIEQEDICWIDKIVTSRAPTQERLPTWDQEGDAEESCEIESRWTITDPAQFANMPGVKRKRRKEMGLAIGKEFWRVELKVLVWVRTRELQFDIEFANQVIGTGFVPISFIFGPRPSEAGTNKDGGGGGVSGSGESLPDQPPLIAK